MQNKIVNIMNKIYIANKNRYSSISEIKIMGDNEVKKYWYGFAKEGFL